MEHAGLQATCGRSPGSQSGVRRSPAGCRSQEATPEGADPGGSAGRHNWTDDEVVRGWRGNVEENLEGAWGKLEEAEFDPDSFNPFETDLSRGEGYCLLTLQIAVWAAAWFVRNEPFAAPEAFPNEVFQRTGPWTLSWVAMIGHDSDTYGATAGPMIAAAHDGLPEEMTRGLAALEGGLDGHRHGCGRDAR